jgi:hypothetical protein
VLHREEADATPAAEPTSYLTPSGNSQSDRETEPLHARPKLMITKTAILLDTLILKDFTQMHGSRQHGAPETAFPVYQTLLDSKKDIAIASAGSAAGILHRLRDLQALDERTHTLSIATNWAYWRLGACYQAFMDVIIVYRRRTGWDVKGSFGVYPCSGSRKPQTEFILVHRKSLYSSNCAMSLALWQLGGHQGKVKPEETSAKRTKVCAPRKGARERHLLCRS